MPANFKTVFGDIKPAIAMVHLGALPGSPLYDENPGIRGILDAARADLLALQQAGFDAVMFGNENDRPYELEVDTASTATMAYVIGELRREITVPFGVWIMIGFIEDIPKELEEAAWIDGASRTEAFLRVIVPLSTPGMVATAILCFIFSWNNFQLALVLGGFDVTTAPVSVFKYADPEAGGSGQMMAAATLVTIPVFFIVLAIQKQLAAGLTVGGISK